MRRTVAITAALLLLGTGAAVTAAPRQRSRRVQLYTLSRAVPVPVYANNRRLGTDALMLKGLARTVLPMRALFTAVGADVFWNPNEQAVYAWQSDGRGVRMAVGEYEAEMLILGDNPSKIARPTPVETRKLDAPALLIDGTVYVPLRAAVEILGAEARWVGSEPAVYVSTTGEPPASEGGARPR